MIELLMAIGYSRSEAENLMLRLFDEDAEGEI